MKILLAIDGSPCSALAVSEVARRGWPPGCEIKVLSVIEPLRIPRPQHWVFTESYYEQLESTDRERTRLNVQAATQQIRAAQANAVIITTEIINAGNPKEVIIEFAKNWEADLIVVGSHNWRGWKRRWLGSVSQAIAAHAPCSVEIVRCCPVVAESAAGAKAKEPQGGY